MSLLDIGTELRHERYFDSHPRVGGDEKNQTNFRMDSISIRTPAWGGLLTFTQVNANAIFQFVPRVGGDDRAERNVWLQAISIRTPAWGGDRQPRFCSLYSCISIRTPAWGVTKRRIFF